MGIDDVGEVDVVSIENDTGRVVLSVIDSMEWTAELEQQHLVKLEQKLNTYLRFVEGGELSSCVPDSRGREIVIEVAFLHQPTQRALKVLASARAIVEEAGFGLRLKGPLGHC